MPAIIAGFQYGYSTYVQTTNHFIGKFAILTVNRHGMPNGSAYERHYVTLKGAKPETDRIPLSVFDGEFDWVTRMRSN